MCELQYPIRTAYKNNSVEILFETYNDRQLFREFCDESEIPWKCVCMNSEIIYLISSDDFTMIALGCNI